MRKPTLKLFSIYLRAILYINYLSLLAPKRPLSSVF